MDATRNDVLKYFPNAYEPDARAFAEGETAAPGAERRPRLDSWTDTPPTDTAGYLELTITDCRRGNTETSVVVRDRPYSPPKPRAKSLRNKPRSEMAEESRERCTRRARGKIRTAAKTIAADRILTLTSRRYLYTLDRFWIAFDEFNRLMRKRFGRRWQYVLVPELHPTSNDHYHGHAAISGNYPVDTVRFIWRQSLRNCFEKARDDHAPGNIDIAYKGDRPWRVNSVARYISKYIGKGIDHGTQHRKRYERSRGSTPGKIKLYAPLGLTDLEIIRKVQEVSGGVLARNPQWNVYGGFDVLLIETETPPKR